jgi:hypothetical protein
MPDLSIEYYWLCETARHWEAKHPRGYRVAWEYQRGGDVQYDWHCECKGFQFRRKCSHIEWAKPLRCGWHQFEDGGECDGKVCPRCKGPITSERWAV